MKQILPLCVFALVVSTPAIAWERHASGSKVQWTFQGSEIVSYAAISPQYNEDPEVLEVTLYSAQDGQITVSIEADLGVGACPQRLGSAQGNNHTSVTLVANLDATTLNGVTLDQCSTH